MPSQTPNNEDLCDAVGGGEESGAKHTQSGGAGSKPRRSQGAPASRSSFPSCRLAPPTPPASGHQHHQLGGEKKKRFKKCQGDTRPRTRGHSNAPRDGTSPGRRVPAAATSSVLKFTLHPPPTAPLRRATRSPPLHLPISGSQSPGSPGVGVLLLRASFCAGPRGF